MPDFAQHCCQGFRDMGDHRDAGNYCRFEFLVSISDGWFVPPVQSAKIDVMGSSDGYKMI